MSVSNTVADNNKEPDDMKGLPMLDSVNVVTWPKKLEVWLMRKKRNHLGLEDRPTRPPYNSSFSEGGIQGCSGHLVREEGHVC